jgi:hypothetical protein|tara:strand:- start:71 stop:328 length:258 start_codon:yes stop_codon:yes gene_type:complete
MHLEQARHGSTHFLKYDLDKETIELHLVEHEMSLKEVKQLRNEIDDVLKRAQPLRASSAPDDLSLSQPPWILRKLFGWQSIIKRA